MKIVSAKTELLATEPMALALCTWTALLLGILYMFFTAFGIVYSGTYGCELIFCAESRCKELISRSSIVEMQFVGLSYVPLGIGILIGWICQPLWERSVHIFEEISLKRQLTFCKVVGHIRIRYEAWDGDPLQNTTFVEASSALSSVALAYSDSLGRRSLKSTGLYPCSSPSSSERVCSSAIKVSSYILVSHCRPRRLLFRETSADPANSFISRYSRRLSTCRGLSYGCQQCNEVLLRSSFPSLHDRHVSKARKQLESHARCIPLPSDCTLPLSLLQAWSQV